MGAISTGVYAYMYKSHSEYYCFIRVLCAYSQIVLLFLVEHTFRNIGALGFASKVSSLATLEGSKGP